MNKIKNNQEINKVRKERIKKECKGKDRRKKGIIEGNERKD